MAAAEVVSRPPDRPAKRKPFTNWMKKITNFKGNDQNETKIKNAKLKKGSAQSGTVRNNPYPESGQLPKQDASPASSTNGQLSFTTPKSRAQDAGGSYSSIPTSRLEEREGHSQSNRSGAPTLATQPETIHSDAGHSKAPTATTGGGALSSIDGAGGANSTFSSPNESQQSLTTTLTTIQSQSPANALGQSSSTHPNSHHQGNTNGPVMFSHQYPTSPAGIATPVSAIPRHVADTMPNTYNSATANNLLTDNASILTLASSSKRRRRRSMDTDASVRAIPPSSVWGGSRESLPLSVLSGNAAAATTEPTGGNLYTTSQSRPSISGLASTERASLYSSQGVAAPALASERNSYYSHKQPQQLKDPADAKSVRSITIGSGGGGGGGGVGAVDARPQFDGRSSAYDARSFNNDAKSLDVNSLRGYEGSVRSGALGHGRNDSLPGSTTGYGSPLTSPGLMRLGNASGGLSGSRRSSDWQDGREEEEEEEGGKEGVEVREGEGQGERGERERRGAAVAAAAVALKGS